MTEYIVATEMRRAEWYMVEAESPKDAVKKVEHGEAEPYMTDDETESEPIAVHNVEDGGTIGEELAYVNDEGHWVGLED